MTPKFGTSGLRGLVTELTPDLVQAYTDAFLDVCNPRGAVHVGRDLRDSSPDLAATVIAAVTRAGYDAIDHGALPTPALALAAIHAALGAPAAPAQEPGAHYVAATALPAYVARYVQAFGAGALAGLRLGVYQHSSVARDVMCDVLSALGAQVVPLARSDSFIPVDTEAVDPETQVKFAAWCADHALDALVSTDGDADRPMVADAAGRIVPGDVLGPLTARSLRAEVICTPVSSNSLVEAMGIFAEVWRTKIGSPFVISAMEERHDRRVAGYEANGGFLLGFKAQGPAGVLDPLITRDSLLPMITPLVAAKAAGQGLADLVATLPARFTAADRLVGVPSDKAIAFLDTLSGNAQARALFFARRAPETAMDLTDGLRVDFADGSVIHLRPSGNAPEFRCYSEADTPERAQSLMKETLNTVAERLM